MSILKIAILSAAATATLGASAAVARPVHHKGHQVCKVEHVHHHAKRVCHWVR